MVNKNAKIYVAGHAGLVGSYLVKELLQDGYTNIIVESSKRLDLTDFDSVNDFMKKINRNLFFYLQEK